MRGNIRIANVLAAVTMMMFGAFPVLANSAFVAEFNALGVAQSGVTAQIASEPNLAESVVDFTAGVASSSNFGATTSLVRLQCDTKCAFKVRPGCAGASASATTSKYLPADGVEFFGVKPGDCVSVITKP